MMIGSAVIRTAVAGALLMMPGIASARNFSCSNPDAEIRCADAACAFETEASGGFTPMSLSRSGERLEICAYSGCWSGRITLRRIRGDFDILHADVGGGRAASSTGSGGLAVIYNRHSRTAQMSWNGFANVMECR